jgi:hypothetical protein
MEAKTGNESAQRLIQQLDHVLYGTPPPANRLDDLTPLPRDPVVLVRQIEQCNLELMEQGVIVLEGARNFKVVPIISKDTLTVARGEDFQSVSLFRVDSSHAMPTDYGFCIGTNAIIFTPQVSYAKDQAKKVKELSQHFPQLSTLAQVLDGYNSPAWQRTLCTVFNAMEELSHASTKRAVWKDEVVLDDYILLKDHCKQHTKLFDFIENRYDPGETKWKGPFELEGKLSALINFITFISTTPGVKDSLAAQQSAKAVIAEAFLPVFLILADAAELYSRGTRNDEAAEVSYRLIVSSILMRRSGQGLDSIVDNLPTLLEEATQLYKEMFLIEIPNLAKAIEPLWKVGFFGNKVSR